MTDSAAKITLKGNVSCHNSIRDVRIEPHAQMVAGKGNVWDVVKNESLQAWPQLGVDYQECVKK